MTRKARRTIRPLHRAVLDQRLTAIQPVAYRVVFPGETLRQVFLDLNVLSAGATALHWNLWMEHYLFYVPLSAVAGDGTQPASKILSDWLADETAQQPTGIPAQELLAPNTMSEWLRKAYDRIAEDWFLPRDMTAPPSNASEFSPLWRAGLHYQDGRHWLVKLPDLTVNVDENVDGTITEGEVLKAWDAFIRSWMKGESTKTYEDYLQEAGVRVPGVKEETEGATELLYKSRQFHALDNRFDPQNAAWRAFFQFRGEVQLGRQRKFFREPGYLILVQLFRPQVYDQNIQSYAAEFTRSKLWQPNEIMRDVGSLVDSFEPASIYQDSQRSIHPHMRHVVGEGLVGPSIAGSPSMGLRIQPFGTTVEETIWPVASLFEDVIAGAGNQWPISSEIAARFEMETTCAWPFVGRPINSRL